MNSKKIILASVLITIAFSVPHGSLRKSNVLLPDPNKEDIQTKTEFLEPHMFTQTYVAGHSYAKGDQVSYNGKIYECLVAGWCSQAVFKPEGAYASQAWKVVGGTPTQTMYACSNGQCSENANGEWYCIEDCETHCSGGQTKYSCSNGACSKSSSGTYDSLSSCSSACTAPTKYSCSNGACSETSWGSYDSLSSCQSACSTPKKYSCSNGACSESSWGSYDSLSSCQDACGTPPPPSSDKVIGLYYVNWARYRKSPYTYDAKDLSQIVDSVTHLYYGFAFFCHPPGQPVPYWDELFCKGKNAYDLVKIDPEDDKNIATMKSYKNTNSKLKLIVAIGGWTFPSAFFSQAVKTASARKAFIASIKSFVQENGFDGINIDWEYPCSEPREDIVKISCANMKTVIDNGGACSSNKFARGFCSSGCEDGDNFLQFLKELKADQPNLSVSIAQAASPVQMATMPVGEIDKVINHWDLMSYDFFVSDIASQDKTAPNQNLYDVPELGFSDWSAAAAIDAMIENGATASKIIFGIAYYGHHWYAPGLSGDSWKSFNIQASIQGTCCGAFKNTYGGTGGIGSQQCGSLMYSEIQAAGFESHYDDATESVMGYLPNQGQDGVTAAGTWISYLDEKAVKAQVDYAMKKGLGGAFAWDSTMDSIENGQFTYKLTHQMADAVNAS